MRCILHIGTEKTATTLLQQWLYENEEFLSEQGVALTRSAHVPNNRKLASYFMKKLDGFARAHGITNQAERDRFFAGFEDELRAEIADKAKTHHTLIFTSEHFHSRLVSQASVSALKAFLEPLFSDFKIICYFREQSKVRTSLYSTVLKRANAQPLSDFRSNAGPGLHYFNYFTSFQKWDIAFGKDSLYPRLFDKGHLKDGDIRKDFLATVLPDLDADKLSYDTKSANESLSRSQAVFYRLINATRPSYVGRHPDPTPQFFKRLIHKFGFFDDKAPIQDTRQAEFFDAFLPSNRKFFREYFDAPDSLFEKPELKATAAESLMFTEEDMSQFIEALLKKQGLIVLTPSEADLLEDLPFKLFQDGKIKKKQAISLLKIASRARPNDQFILAKLEKLHKS